MPLKVFGFSAVSDRRILILVGSLLAVVVLAVLAAPMWKPHRRRLLGSEGFTDAGAKFYMIKADWCPHCKHAKPLWSELQSAASAGSIKTSDGSAVEIVDPIDGSDADALGLPYKGFPTFVLKKGGQMSRCDADRSVGAWSSWLQQQ